MPNLTLGSKGVRDPAPEFQNFVRTAVYFGSALGGVAARSLAERAESRRLLHHEYHLPPHHDVIGRARVTSSMKS